MDSKKDTGANKEEIQKPILDKYEKESDAYYSTARLWDDGLIDPVDTRKVLAMGLSVAHQSSWSKKKKRHLQNVRMRSKKRYATSKY